MAIKMTKRGYTGYVNSCGRLNLNTGRNVRFNVLEEKDWQSAHITLFVNSRGEFRVMGGWSTYETKTNVDLYTSSTHCRIGYYRAVFSSIICNREGLDRIKRWIDANTVLFGTWD